MSEDTIRKDRSPRSPNYSLEDALLAIQKLHREARSTSVRPEVVAKALGYASLNGAALSSIATLTQYGLVLRDKGNVQVSPLALKILHPTSPQQRTESIAAAVASPQVFAAHLQDFDDCGVEVIAGQLIQNSFTPERARRVAEIFVQNKDFAKQQGASNNGDAAKTSGAPDAESGSNQIKTQSAGAAENTKANPSPQVSQAAATPNIPTTKMLATYTIPLGGNQATLVFTGEKLTVDDFDALLDFVEFSKKQFARAEKAAGFAAASQSQDVVSA